jgi:hypothetical protein
MNIRHLFQLKSYERIEMVIHRHPVFLLRNILLLVVLVTIPAGIVMMLMHFNSTIASNPIILAIGGVLGSIYFLGIWLFFFSLTLDYYLDIWVLTNDRLISVEQQGLFSRVVSETDLWLIQDVTSEIKGIPATIFGYGNLHVQTAAEQARFHFENSANPNGIRQKMLALAEADRHYHLNSVEMKKIGL